MGRSGGRGRCFTNEDDVVIAFAAGCRISDIAKQYFTREASVRDAHAIVSIALQNLVACELDALRADIREAGANIH